MNLSVLALIVFFLYIENSPKKEIFDRDYDADSERKKVVEEFYRMNHTHQSFEFVRLYQLLS